MLRLLHEKAGAKSKETNQWDCFPILQCPNRGPICSAIESILIDMASIEYQRQHVFQPTLQPQCSLGGFSVAAISKTSTFEVPKFSQSFSPLGSPRAAASEAPHRCFSQLRTATFWSSSSFSRPRRPWMRRGTTAVASDEVFSRTRSFGGKPSCGMGSLCKEVDYVIIIYKNIYTYIYI